MSLSHPGGNITGMSMLLTELSVKELEIFKETFPNAVRIGILWNPTTPSHPTALTAIKAASEKLGVQVVLAQAGTVAEIQEAFETMSRERVSGVACLVIAALQRAQRTPGGMSNEAPAARDIRKQGET